MNKGFTLIELMVVVAILGVLSTIGIPIYTNYVDTARVTTAQNNLRAVFLQQQEYFTDNNAYYTTGATCNDYTTTINTNLFAGVNVLQSDDYTYCITQTTVNDFTARAEEVAGTRVFTIDNNNNDNW